MRAETELRVVAEKLAEEELQRALEVRDAHAFIHVEPFHLVELREMRGIDFVAAIRGAGRDDADRRRAAFHRANLHRAGVRAQQSAIGQIKGVLLVARRMIGGRVERIETMPLRLDVRPIGEREAHAAENLDRAILELRDRMQRAEPRRGAGQRHIDAGKRRGIGVGEQRGLAFIERRGDRGCARR